MRSARQCIQEVQAAKNLTPGMYVDVPRAEFPYPHYYYFRTIRPWTWADKPSPEGLGRYVTGSAEPRATLVWAPTFLEFHRQASAGGRAMPRPPMIVFPGVDPDVLLLLPGPYAVCSVEGPTDRTS
jgi:hypothetical protein